MATYAIVLKATMVTNDPDCLQPWELKDKIREAMTDAVLSAEVEDFLTLAFYVREVQDMPRPTIN